MKAVLLLVLTIFMTIVIAACQSMACDDEYAGSVLISRHPSQLGTETPLSVYSPIEAKLTMIVTNTSDFRVDTVINNNSEWYVATDFIYTVEVFTANQWLPIEFFESIGFSTAVGPAISPGDSLTKPRIILPNYNPFPPPYSLPLEPGRYRVRRTVNLSAGEVDAFRTFASHELVAEFYVE